MISPPVITNFDNIRFVLVRPSHPGNIGAVARAMKTMAFTRLTIVSPIVNNPLQNSEAIARSAGALDILKQAHVVSSLEEALEGVHYSLALSARIRKFGPTAIYPRAAAIQLFNAFCEKKVEQAAIVFGNEQSGLTNHDLGCCQAQIKIPANAAYSSLNLASAAQIIAYELHIALSELTELTENEVEPMHSTTAYHVAVPSPNLNLAHVEQPLATHNELSHLYKNLEEALIAIHFVNPHHPKKLLPRLQQMARKARLQSEEVRLLQGIIKQILQLKK